MRSLIPYMADPLKAADFFRDQRWPDGVQCPICGAEGDEIEELSRCPNGVHRYHCPRCAQRKEQDFATFTDRTATIFEGSKLPPDVWLLVIALHELGLNAREIAKAAEVNERTAQRATNLLDGGLYEAYHLDPERKLSGTVEADEAYQKAGTKATPSALRRMNAHLANGRRRHAVEGVGNGTCRRSWVWLKDAPRRRKDNPRHHQLRSTWRWCTTFKQRRSSQSS